MKEQGEQLISIKPPHEADVGEYTSFEQLAAVGGKFYTMDGLSYCDTPLASFVLDSFDAPGYRRIE